MNAARRKAIAAVLSTVEVAISELETIRDSEQEAFDNMPEGLQSGERGEAAQTAIGSIEDSISNLESARDSLSDAGGES